jgi:hypothetical protein
MDARAKSWHWFGVLKEPVRQPPMALDRHQRLAAKLRENLKRRKAQARARSDEEAVPKPTEGEGHGDEGLAGSTKMVPSSTDSALPEKVATTFSVRKRDQTKT